MNRVIGVRELLMYKMIIVYLFILPVHHEVPFIDVKDKVGRLLEGLLKQQLYFGFIPIVGICVYPLNRFEICVL